MVNNLAFMHFPMIGAICVPRGHFQIYLIRFLAPLLFSICLKTQETLKTMLVQNFGGTKKTVLW